MPTGLRIFLYRIGRPGRAFSVPARRGGPGIGSPTDPSHLLRHCGLLDSYGPALQKEGAWM